MNTEVLKQHTYLESLSIIIVLYLLSSCNSTTASKKESASTLDNIIEFNVNGSPVHTTGWNISRFDMGHGINLNVTSNMHEDKRTLLFNINGWEEGSYTLHSGNKTEHTGYGRFKPDYTDVLTSYSFDDGQFIINSIDTVKGVINASFHGKAIRNNEVVTITNGRIINGKLKPGIYKY